MIAVIVPSRGRPQNIAALVEAWEATKADGSRFADLFVIVDEDDPCCADYTRLQLPVGGETFVIERRRLGGTLNHFAPEFARTYDGIGFMGDDHRPRSDGWDARIGAAINDGGIVYGDDLNQGRNLPTAVFMDSLIVRTLGYFVLPGQIHLYMDDYWKKLGEQLGTLRYLPDVVIEHMHPTIGKAPNDQTYEEANCAGNWANDKRVFDIWVQTQMSADVAKVKAAL